MRTMRERVWAAANVQLETVVIDTDTTVHTLYGNLNYAQNERSERWFRAAGAVRD
jgi:hypothetical protein